MSKIFDQLTPKESGSCTQANQSSSENIDTYDLDLWTAGPNKTEVVRKKTNYPVKYKVLMLYGFKVIERKQISHYWPLWPDLWPTAHKDDISLKMKQTNNPIKYKVWR